MIEIPATLILSPESRVEQHEQRVTIRLDEEQLRALAKAIVGVSFTPADLQEMAMSNFDEGAR